MDETIKLDRVSGLTETDRAEIRALSLAVYPPEEAATWLGRNLEWAEHEWYVRIWSRSGELVSYVSVHLRSGAHNNKGVLVGGVGGIKTHPEARRRGYAERGT